MTGNTFYNTVSNHWHTRCGNAAPFVKEVFPLALANVESKRNVLATIAYGLPIVGTMEFSCEETLNWKQSYPLLRMLFLEWATYAPDGMQPLFELFPVQLSCVISRRMSPFDLPFACPADCMLTGSKFIFFWYKARQALDDLLGLEDRIALLTDAFTRPHVDNSTHITYTKGPDVKYPYCGDMLICLIHLTYSDYISFQQPSFAPAYEALRGYMLSNGCLPQEVSEYLVAVYHGHIMETYLDPVIHYFLLDHTSLTKTYPDIFPRHVPPVDWSFFMRPTTTPSTQIQSFEKPLITDTLMAVWKAWSAEHPTFESLVKSLDLMDVTDAYVPDPSFDYLVN